MPEVIDLVAELCLIAQNQEAVCKAFQDEKLLLILGRQGNTIPLTIQTQVVILKVLMIISSAVTEPWYQDKNRSHSFTRLLKSAVNTLFFQRFCYVHPTICVRLEEIIYNQYSHLLISPI